MLREYASSVFFSLFPVVQNHMVLFLKVYIIIGVK